MPLTDGALLPAEIALAVACCRTAFRTTEDAPAPVGHDVDWKRFLAACRRHRVQGLASYGIRALDLRPPKPIADSLVEEATSIAQHGLRCAAESARLLRVFDAAETPILFLKGLPLGALAYRDPFLKMGWDIDVLVRPDSLPDAAALLCAAGYQVVTPRPRSDLRSWHRRRKESVWRNCENGLFVELHTRLSDHPSLIPTVGMDSPPQMIEVVPSIALPTLRIEELFAYLCVHGASSAWFRLKWLADLAGLIADRAEDEVASLYSESQRLGAGKAAGQALLLAHGLFDTPLTPGIRDELTSDRAVRWLTAAALEQLRAGREPTERPFGTATIHLTQLFLRPGAAFKISELRRQIADMLT